MSNYLSERVDPNGDPNQRLSSSNMDLAHLAELIANGEASFPTGLMKDEKQRLLQAVQDRRRRRLVQYIAGAIAQDILRDHAQPHGGSSQC